MKRRGVGFLLLPFLYALSAHGQSMGARVVRDEDRHSPGYASYERANELFTAKRFSESGEAIDEALRLDPKLVPALTLKAKLAMAHNRFEVARQSLEQALEIDPKSSYAQFLYGLEAYMTNDLQQALPRFERARKLNATDPRAALYLGLTCESLGRTGDALLMYEDAVRLERLAGAPQAQTFLAGARLLLLLNRVEDAERWMRQAIAVAPNLRDGHFELARLLLRKRQAVEAVAEGERALDLKGGDITEAQIHYLLIRAAQQNGDAAGAARHAAAVRALETLPEQQRP